eukprot:scaffold3114_cov114-Isochrysis_galbana.AAC.2
MLRLHVWLLGSPCCPSLGCAGGWVAVAWPCSVWSAHRPRERRARQRAAAPCKPKIRLAGQLHRSQHARADDERGLARRGLRQGRVRQGPHGCSATACRAWQTDRPSTAPVR